MESEQDETTMQSIGDNPQTRIQLVGDDVWIVFEGSLRKTTIRMSRIDAFELAERLHMVSAPSDEEID